MITRYYHGNSMDYMLDSIRDVLESFSPNSRITITLERNAVDISNDHLIDLILILLTAGTDANAGHTHGIIDQRSRVELERLILKLEAQNAQ